MKRFLILFFIWSQCYAAGLVDLKFGQYQIADSQWNVSACMYTATCQIYSKQPGVAYKIPWYNGQLSWAPGDYVAFVKTGNTTNPYNAIQYSSNGTQKAVMGTGHIINIGPDYFFFVGNDNNTGQLFSMTSGFSNTSGVTWTGTLNPTLAQVDTYASNGSTTPLAAGQTSAPATPVYSAGISSAQQSRVTAFHTRTITNNLVQIDQVGNNNTVNITQIGNNNLINADLNGNINTVAINQGVTGPGQNEIKLRSTGDLNSIVLNQSRDQLGNATGTNGHYAGIDLTGYQNTITTQQTNANGIGGHYVETTVNGNQNNILIKQTDNGNKTMFNTVNGNNNTVNAVQKDSGQHYLETSLIGNGNTVNSVQEGSLQNRASINITNAGGPGSVDLQQTGGQVYNITTSCVNSGGCAPIVIRQGY
jgi:hypothetical protein